MINPNELLFIVDENNIPLAPEVRKIAHANNLWHRTAGIWVINNKKQILCQKRSLKKDKHPGKWEAYFGGHLGPNEDALESAVREVSEELGHAVTTQQLISYPHVLKSDKPDHKEFQYIYVLILNKESHQFHFEKEEIDELQWVDLEKLQQILLQIKDPQWVQKNWDETILNWIVTLPSFR